MLQCNLPPAAMHNTFQRDLYRLRLEVARSYVKAVTASLTPITSSQDSSLKISAQVCGRKREEGGGSVRVLLITLSVLSVCLLCRCKGWDRSFVSPSLSRTHLPLLLLATLWHSSVMSHSTGLARSSSGYRLAYSITTCSCIPLFQTSSPPLPPLSLPSSLFSLLSCLSWFPLSRTTLKQLWSVSMTWDERNQSVSLCSRRATRFP